MIALRENIDSEEVTEKHFDEAMKKVSPSVSKNDEESYRQIEQKYLKSAKASLLDDGKSYLG